VVNDLQGQATCTFGNLTVLADASAVAGALAEYSSGRCKPLRLAHTEVSLCGCQLYQTPLLLAAQVACLWSPCAHTLSARSCYCLQLSLSGVCAVRMLVKRCSRKEGGGEVRGVGGLCRVEHAKSSALQMTLSHHLCSQ
jgi:hypothetical protein